MSQLRALKKSSFTSSKISESWPAQLDTGEVLGKARLVMVPWKGGGEPLGVSWSNEAIEYEDRSCSSKSLQTSEYMMDDATCAAPEKCHVLGCVVHKQQRLTLPEGSTVVIAHAQLKSAFEQFKQRMTKHLVYGRADAKWSALNERLYLSNSTGKGGRTSAIMAETVEFALKILGLNKATTVSTFLDALEKRPVPTKAEFRRLAKENPRELIAWIKSGTLEPTILTFAAEILGEVSDSELVVPCLIPLLAHPSSVVREGAIYGIENHMEWPGVKSKLHEIAEADPREGVREAAREALD